MLGETVDVDLEIAHSRRGPDAPAALAESVAGAQACRGDLAVGIAGCRVIDRDRLLGKGVRDAPTES